MGPASIQGMKFDDLDGDRTRDPEEPGLLGWEIQLWRSDGSGNPDTLLEVAVTAADGTYAFADVEPGVEYVVTEVQQAGWTQTTPVAPYVLSPNSGEVMTGVDFGNRNLAEIRGVKFDDDDGDGVKDPDEVGIGGITIYIDTNGNNVPDAGEPSALTEVDTGAYSIANVEPDAAHTVREHVPSFPVPGAADPWSAQTYPAGDGSWTITPDPGEVVTGVDFGNFIVRAEIHGIKYDDRDADGVRDAGEPGLDGWTIYLDANGDGVLDAGEFSTVTAGGGLYAFTDLHPIDWQGLAGRDYEVREVPQPDWVQTAPASPHILTLLPGVVFNDIDLGNHRLNEPPNVPGVGTITAYEGVFILRRFTALDPEGDPITFAVDVLPPGLTLTAYPAGSADEPAPHADIDGVPDPGSAGPYATVLTVSDGFNIVTRMMDWDVRPPISHRSPARTRPSWGTTSSMFRFPFSRMTKILKAVR